MNPLQAGHAPLAIPDREETGKIKPHTFTGVLVSFRADPLTASFPNIYPLTKDEDKGMVGEWLETLARI